MYKFFFKLHYRSQTNVTDCQVIVRWLRLLTASISLDPLLLSSAFIHIYTATAYMLLWCTMYKGYDDLTYIYLNTIQRYSQIISYIWIFLTYFILYFVLFIVLWNRLKVIFHEIYKWKWFIWEEIVFYLWFINKNPDNNFEGDCMCILYDKEMFHADTLG